MADNRRNVAAQFFMEESEPEGPNVPTYERVVELLNQASLMQKDSLKVTTLKIVKELIVNKEPGLLDNFLDEMLAFQTDRAQDVRKFIVTFIEDAVKQDPEVLTKTVGNINVLMEDEAVAVIKRVLLSMGNIFNVALRWIGTSKSVNDVKKRTWQYVQSLRGRIADMLDSDNDGIRTHAIKFLETVILTLSAKTAESEIPKNAAKIYSVDQLPAEHPFLKIDQLEDEGKEAFDAVVKYQQSAHISSVNLMTCLGITTSIAKQRPQFMAQVITGFETLHVNLPPTLAKSQVSSVRKNLKMQLLMLLKLPSSQPFHAQITTLLTDLGATQAEVMKAMPKVDRVKKRKQATEDSDSSAYKKPRYIPTEIGSSRDSPKPGASTADADDDDDYLMTPIVSSGRSKKSSKPEKPSTLMDTTAEDLISRLTPQNVADLVLLSMVMLPDDMPSQFQSSYTPIAAAGTDAQVKHLSRLLATQLISAGLVTDDKASEPSSSKSKDSGKDMENDALSNKKQSIQTLVGGSTAPAVEPEPMDVTSAIMPTAAPSRKGVKVFKLAGVTQPLDHNQIMKHSQNAFKRILHVEKFIQVGQAPEARLKILTGLVAQFGGMLKNEIEEYIFLDVRNRADLALAWLYQEYANFQGYNLSSAMGVEKLSINSYDDCLTRLLSGLLQRPDQKEGLFSRILLEAPCITPNAIAVLRSYCQDETRIYFGMTTIKELIVKRPCMKLEFLDVLLDFTSHEKPEVRNNAIRVTKKLHERSDLRDPIERYALYYLKLLLTPNPPEELFGADKGRPMNEENKVRFSEWSEDNIKLCLYLYLGLLPVNHKMVHELAKVYTSAIADIKRAILRVLENPVKGMGMGSPELLTLVENCPKGAETLVTRIIHILTDKAAPSPELVDRVRDLYRKRVADVRFLIPVLNGLTKEEVVDAIPKLIKLNPVVVKEVFNRLLVIPGTFPETEGGFSSPITPAELLVCLHTIEPSKCDMKTVIKSINMCFSETQVYTQEVLALVMQQLMELNMLPTLLMRTVIQSLAMYPKLNGLVMNIMQRLISKQVWKNKKVWEGFVKCCQRTKPHCFQVLLQLPAAQLKNCFEMAPDLREPLLRQIQNFTPTQQAHIPKSIMTVLQEKIPEVTIKKEGDKDAASVVVKKEPVDDKRELRMKIKQERSQSPETSRRRSSRR